MTRMGEQNPFHGHRHTEEWKAATRARQEWPAEDIEALVNWYAARKGRKLDLAELSVLLGRPKSSISRKARLLGLTERVRRPGRTRRAKHPDIIAARAAIAAAAKQRILLNGHPRGMLGKAQRPEVIQKASAAAKAKVDAMTPEERQAMRDRALGTKRRKYGRLGPSLTGTNVYSRCKHGRREDLGGQFFRSSWEANYARFLNLLKQQGQIAKWEFEAETFWFEKIRRGVRSYTPDFRITEPNGYVYFVEVKGWMDPKSKTKLKRMRKYHPHVDLRVVGASAYNEIARKLGGAIPGWEAA